MGIIKKNISPFFLKEGSPEEPRRTMFNMTVIGEEIRVEESPVSGEESRLEESPVLMQDVEEERGVYIFSCKTSHVTLSFINFDHLPKIFSTNHFTSFWLVSFFLPLFLTNLMQDVDAGGKSPGACEPQNGHRASHCGQRASESNQKIYCRCEMLSGCFEMLSGRFEACRFPGFFP